MIDQVDWLSVVIAREDVEAGDISGTLQMLQACVSSTENALKWFERVSIYFHGYNNDQREIYEIPEIRAFMDHIDQHFPFWLFFLEKTSPNLYVIARCFLLPHLAPETQQRIHSEQLAQLLSARWFPAMNHICAVASFSEQKIEELSNRCADYFTDGPLSQ